MGGYKRIKEEIEELEAGIRLWKARHNTLSIIARLPPEILSTIFKCVAAAGAQQSHLVGSKIRWIHVTHVCSHWRRVALEDPSLWTTIPFSHHRWASEMLERSKMASLTIMINLYAKDPVYVKLVESSLTRIARIQTLCLRQNLTFLYDDMLTTILANLVEPAPRLESLEVSFNDRVSVHTLPSGLFSGDAPRLRELELHECALAWDVPFLRNLTTLKMYFVPPTTRPSISQVLAALSNMSHLHTLVLQSILPEGSPEVAAGRAGSGIVAQLPQLAHLSIEADVPEGAFLLDHLVYPLTVSIILVGTLRCKSPADASYNLPAVQSFCKVLGKFQPIRCLVARYTLFAEYIQLNTYDIPGTCCQIPLTKAKVDFTLKISSEHKTWEEIHQSLWTSIPMKDLESLHVIDNVGSLDWSQIFTTLAAAKLSRLNVTGDSGIGFLRAFCPDAPVPLNKRVKRRIPLKLSSLREFAIKGWTFDDLTADGSCFDWLKICLEDRRKRRGAIKELFLIECIHITDDDVDTLRKIVKKVDWDGLEGFSEDEEDEESDGFDFENSSDYGFFVPW